MRDVLAVEFKDIAKMLPQPKVIVHYKVDIGLGDSPLVLDLDKHRAAKRDRYDLASFKNHLSAVAHSCKVLKEIIEHLTDFYQQHRNERVELDGYVLKRLDTIASKSFISYDDLNTFRHLIMDVIRVVVPQPVPQVIVSDDRVVRDLNDFDSSFEERTLDPETYKFYPR